MSVQRGTSSEIWHMDKLRHCDPKTARKMTRNGNGARHKQLAVLRTMEGRMPTMSDGTQPQWRARLDAATTQRLEAIKEAIGGRTNAEVIFALLATHDRDACHTPHAVLTAEAANIVRATQERLRLPTQLDAVKRMSEAITNAETRARKVVELEGQLRETREARDTAMRHAQAEQRAVAQAPAVAPQLRPEGEEVLFDFTSTFTGATATADPSGEVVVAVPQEKLNALFPIWARAVKVLGVGRKEG